MRAWLLWVSGAMLGMSLHACSTTVGEASATSVDAGSDTGVDAAISAAMDASTPADGSVDASGDAEGGALTRYLYIFGSAGSSYRAAVATAGLGPWEEVPSLLVPRSSAAFVMTADGTAVVAGGDVAGGGAFLRTALSTPSRRSGSG